MLLTEIEAANEMVVAERDELLKQLAASQAREAELRDCVELYANEYNWADQGPFVKVNAIWVGETYNGPEPAQKCLKKVGAMK